MATKEFYPGQFIVEYSGELLTAFEARKREEIYNQRGETGSFILKFHHNNQATYIDATEETGRLGRLLNHSLVDQNCVPKKIIVANQPRVVFLATKKILAGQEILYDYGERRKHTIKQFPWLSKKEELKIAKGVKGKLLTKNNKRYS